MVTAVLTETSGTQIGTSVCVCVCSLNHTACSLWRWVWVECGDLDGHRVPDMALMPSSSETAKKSDNKLCPLENPLQRVDVFLPRSKFAGHREVTFSYSVLAQQRRC